MTITGQGTCGERYPGSDGAYCPCTRAHCDGFHQCAHGDRWYHRAIPTCDETREDH